MRGCARNQLVFVPGEVINHGEHNDKSENNEADNFDNSPHWCRILMSKPKEKLKKNEISVSSDLKG